MTMYYVLFSARDIVTRVGPLNNLSENKSSKVTNVFEVLTFPFTQTY